MEKKNQRAAAEIVAALEERILDGKLQPGERVDEVSLAKSFGVSRTPVREALLELAGTGMIVQRPNRGAFVAEMTLEDVFDVYEVLAELEGLCARLAARRMTQDERRALGVVHGRMGTLLASRHRDRYIELDEQFHGMLIRAARNAALGEHIAICIRRIAPVRRMSMEMSLDLDKAYAEHSALVRAVTARDAREAERIMVEHVALRSEQAKDLVAHWKTRRKTVAAA